MLIRTFGSQGKQFTLERELTAALERPDRGATMPCISLPCRVKVAMSSAVAPLNIVRPAPSHESAPIAVHSSSASVSRLSGIANCDHV